MKIIKSAFRMMTKKAHPDLNPDDPHATEKFMKLTSAHKALTDDVARENWKRYGNPDGPQMMSVRSILYLYGYVMYIYIGVLCD